MNHEPFFMENTEISFEGLSLCPLRLRGLNEI
jgi:hypothetical protein